MPHTIMTFVGTLILATDCHQGFLFSVPQDGFWSTWSEFNACSVSCGGGTQIRTRQCSNPPADFGGENCTGLATETAQCNEASCDDNG